MSALPEDVRDACVTLADLTTRADVRGHIRAVLEYIDAEPARVAAAVAKEQARTALLADHIIGWCAAVDDDSTWDSWDRWFKGAAWPTDTTPFDVVMREHYLRAAREDTEEGAFAARRVRECKITGADVVPTRADATAREVPHA